jgi:hypothetical protein
MSVERLKAFSKKKIESYQFPVHARAYKIVETRTVKRGI